MTTPSEHAQTGNLYFRAVLKRVQGQRDQRTTTCRVAPLVATGLPATCVGTRVTGSMREIYNDGTAVRWFNMRDPDESKVTFCWSVPGSKGLLGAMVHASPSRETGVMLPLRMRREAVWRHATRTRLVLIIRTGVVL